MEQAEQHEKLKDFQSARLTELEKQQHRIKSNVLRKGADNSKRQSLQESVSSHQEKINLEITQLEQRRELSLRENESLWKLQQLNLDDRHLLHRQQLGVLISQQIVINTKQLEQEKVAAQAQKRRKTKSFQKKSQPSLEGEKRQEEMHDSHVRLEKSNIEAQMQWLDEIYRGERPRHCKYRKSCHVKQLTQDLNRLGGFEDLPMDMDEDNLPQYQAISSASKELSKKYLSWKIQYKSYYKKSWWKLK